MIELTTAFYAAALAIALYIIICALRVFLGPSAADRTVALDTINTLVIGGMIALGAAMMETLFIDIAIVYAILSFITTLFIAKYLEGGVS
ncbi:MAG: cation:proton antiporter [Candidatus Thermoplasmatota archaeon]|nr:cation:proton antiporter [Candidatus Thermoplasmatota archaeon]MBS3789359.1 cation:proton antiporter [Candidatus Thermoplasmatota archaeon]